MKGVSKRLLGALLMVCWSSFLPAQDAGEQALDAHKRALDEERRANQLKRSATEESRADLGKPVEHKRDAALCERSRQYAQMACGAPYSGRSRSPRCTEAKILLQQDC